ncbi:unnamed protein product [Adineta ricciae]|uniref:NAD(P)(+)--arginine ADP-ribosyltransferase n=1 Tax=Adineta ricciae TaxID=249248 RepID=A0A816F4T1_ADIRI|nr:unnamed protein product [Adineta ricciae]CAF1654704.1 unnamed protein product [Adineta ricciae]
MTNEPVFWYYKTNVSLWPNIQTSDSSTFEWTKYHDFEIEIIEKAFQKKEPYVILNKYRIDFKHFIQINLNSDMKQCPIKRECGSIQKMSERKHRFVSISGESTVNAVGSYDAANAWCPFLIDWQNSAVGRRASLNLSVCIKACAQGIVDEAALDKIHSNTKVSDMAKKILSCLELSDAREEVLKTCVYLYTHDSFLYQTLNKAVREFDKSKLNTLGPFCYFLHEYSRMDKGFLGTVYRGAKLSLLDIEMYEKAVGQWQTWTAFTSASKNRSVAELYGVNTLFIIHITNFTLGGVRGCDISHLSKFPDEEEVLIPAGSIFCVTSVEQDLSQKYIIHMKL